MTYKVSESLIQCLKDLHKKKCELEHITMILQHLSNIKDELTEKKRLISFDYNNIKEDILNELDSWNKIS